MRRNVTLAILLLLTFVTALRAQQNWCPPPRFATVDDFKKRLVDLVNRHRRAPGLVSTSLAPSPPPGCPQLPLDTDLNAVMDDLLRWSVHQDSDGLESTVLYGVLGALRDRQRPRPTIFVVQDVFRPAESRIPYQPPRLRIPVEALRYGVEHDAANSTNVIRHLAVEEPQVADLLLEMARAPEGPPSRPDLPAGVVEVLFRFPQTGEDAIRAELARAPGLIRHPRARCIVERGPAECPRRR